MKKIYTFLTIAFINCSLSAQYKGITFDYEKSVFGENQPLPAEAHIMLQGNADTVVGLIELDILEPKGRDERLPLYSNRWKRTKKDDGTRFLLPINYKLKGSSEYDFRFKYYQPISKKEKEVLSITLHTHLNTYLEQVMGVGRNSIQLEQNTRQIMRSMNKIVHKGLNMYRNRTDTDFEGFSDIVEQKLKQIAHTSLSKGKILFGKEVEAKDAKIQYREKLLKELRIMISSELSQYLNLEWFKLIDSKYLDNYSTEKSKRTVAIQAGFGGVYLDGNSQGITFGASPYIGLAFPLGKKAFSSKILSNTSINIGVFLMDMKGPNNTTVSGPIFKRPTYVGLSYKLFRFVHLNAGATFLEDAATAGQIQGLGNRVYIRPYIGVSAQVDLWMDFSK